VSFGEETLIVDLEDGRQIAVPLAWFPRLTAAGERERLNWELIGRGVGIHWPDLDEDISVENLLGTREDLLLYRGSAVPEGDVHSRISITRVGSGLTPPPLEEEKRSRGQRYEEIYGEDDKPSPTPPPPTS